MEQTNQVPPELLEGHEPFECKNGRHSWETKYVLQGFYTIKMIYDSFGPHKFLKATATVLTS